MKEEWHRLSEVDIDSREAVCSRCGPTTIKSRGISTSGKRMWRCIHAQKLPNVPPAKPVNRRWHHLKGDACEICGRDVNLVIDHNHKTDTFRGTLCHRCNLGIGMFLDDIDLLTKAIKYLS